MGGPPGRRAGPGREMAQRKVEKQSVELPCVAWQKELHHSLRLWPWRAAMLSCRPRCRHWPQLGRRPWPSRRPRHWPISSTAMLPPHGRSLGPWTDHVALELHDNATMKTHTTEVEDMDMVSRQCGHGRAMRPDVRATASPVATWQWRRPATAISMTQSPDEPGQPPLKHTYSSWVLGHCSQLVTHTHTHTHGQALDPLRGHGFAQLEGVTDHNNLKSLDLVERP